MIISREGIDSNSFVPLRELAGIVLEAVIGDDDPLVVTIEGVEGLGDCVQFETRAEKKSAGNAQIGGGVVRPGEGVAAVTR